MPFVGGVGAGGGGTSPFVSAAGIISKVTAADVIVFQPTTADEQQLIIGRGTDGGTPVSNILEITNAGGGTILTSIGPAGQHYLPAGTQALPALSLVGTPTSGFYWLNTTTFRYVRGGSTNILDFAGAGSGALNFASGVPIAWSGTSNNPSAAKDVGLARSAAGILAVTDGSSGLGRLGTIQGTAASAAIGQDGALSTGIYWASGVNITLSGTTAYMFRSFGRLGSGIDFGWSSNADPTAAVTDTGLIRKSAGVLGLTNGSTGGSSLFLADGQLITWSSTTTFGAADGGFNRVGSGILQLNTGTAAGWGQLNLVRGLFGNGATNAGPTTGRISGTGGSGTDIAGGSLRLEPGQGTGTGLGGSIIFQYAPAAAGTGSGANTLQTAGQVSEGGAAGSDQYVGLFLGSGHKSATVAAGYLAAPEPAGANLAGTSLNIRGGSSTGSAKGGPIIFAICPTGLGAGSTVNPYQEAGRFDLQGSGGGEVIGLVLGTGHKSAAPNIGILMAPQATGTDTAGAELWIRGGAATGNADPGEILFETTTVGASGSSVQTYATRLTIDDAAANFTVPIQRGGTQVVNTRVTGYTAFTGAVNRGTAYDTATVTLVQLAERVAAIQADLTAHGLIGA